MNEQLDDLKAFARILNQRVERLEKENEELKHQLAACRESLANSNHKLSIAVVALKNARNVIDEQLGWDAAESQVISDRIFELTGELEA